MLSIARFMLAGSALALAVGCGSNATPGGVDPDQPNSTAEGLLTGATAFGFAYVHGGSVIASRSHNERVVNPGTSSATTAYGTNTVVRTGPGTYAVTMSGLASAGGNAQVVAEGSNANRCRLLSWLTSGTNEVVTVQCNAPNGTPADTDFDVMFYAANGVWSASPYADSAYAYFDPGGSMPAGAYNYNSGTAGSMPNTAVPTGTGAYNVTLPKVHYQNASVLVSAYGGAGAPFCKIGGWFPSGNDTIVTVDCFDTLGHPASGIGFSLSYTTSGPTIGEQGGHGWVTGGSMPLAYAGVTGPIQACSGAVALNTPGNGITVSGLSVWGPPYSPANMAQVAFTTAYGGGSAYCKLSSVAAAATSISANVQCYTAGGVATTSPFTVMTTSNQPSGPC